MAVNTCCVYLNKDVPVNNIHRARRGAGLGLRLVALEIPNIYLNIFVATVQGAFVAPEELNIVTGTNYLSSASVCDADSRNTAPVRRGIRSYAGKLAA